MWPAEVEVPTNSTSLVLALTFTMKSKPMMLPSTVLFTFPGSIMVVLRDQASMPAIGLSGLIKKESLHMANLLMVDPLKRRPNQPPQSKIREKDLMQLASNEDLISVQNSCSNHFHVPPEFLIF